jgi:cyclase
MLKRLIGIVLVKNGLAVQSFGYKKYLPLGKPEIVVKNLDSWMVDEIAVVSIDTDRDEPDYQTLEKIMHKRISTPLIIGGGIRTASHAQKLIQIGADRLILEKLFSEQKADVIRTISDRVGKQALIRSCPLIIVENDIRQYINATNIFKYFDREFEHEVNDLYSEILIIDKEAEGYENSFDVRLIDIPILEKQKILFGGISTKSQYASLIKRNDVAAIGVGNFLNYKELATEQFKDKKDYEASRLVDFGRRSRGERDW